MVHLISDSPILSQFILFANNHFDDEHTFLYHGDKSKYLNSLDIVKVRKTQSILSHLIKPDKIILHGLFDNKIVLLLFLFPWILKKCYWVIWGGDLHYKLYRKKGFKNKIIHLLRRHVIRRIPHFVTYIKGDYELVKEWYGAKGKYHECIMYPSNLYTDNNINFDKNEVIAILVGNSADFTNNHEDVFRKLEKYKDEKIKIITPLSYGEKVYAQKVVNKGRKLFGTKFIPLRDFMPINKYLGMLEEIDIAIFAHKRQQAMGNIIKLLGLGKKVYIRDDISPWKLFSDMGVTVFNISNINLEAMKDSVKVENRNKIKKYFSEKNLKTQWENIIK